MLGLRLFVHALRMVFSNIIAMLQIFLLPLLVTLLAAMALTSYLGLGPLFLFSGQTARFSGMDGPTAALFLLALLVIWCALLNGVVNWHRFILLGEAPSKLMLRLSFMQVLKYILGFIIILLLLIIPASLLTMVVGRIAIGFVQDGSYGIAQAIMFALNLLFLMAFLTLSPILPAAAIDRSLKVGDAPYGMTGSFGALLICALGLCAVQWGGNYLLQLLVAANLPLAQVASLLVPALLAMIGVSLLTTIYGHFVEGRALR